MLHPLSVHRSAVSGTQIGDLDPETLSSGSTLISPCLRENPESVDTQDRARFRGR